MGKRGAPPKPIGLRKLEGTFRRDRHGSDVEPDSLPLGVEAPKNLGWEGQRIWTTYRDMFIRYGVLTELDSEAFFRLCKTFDYVQEIEELISKEGWTRETQRGPARHPLAAQRDSFIKEQFTLMGRFGMTPSDRGGIEIKKAANSGFRAKPQ